MQGIWTPDVIDINTSRKYAIGANNCKFLRIGNYILVHGYIECSGVGNFAPTSSFYINNLPFALKSYSNGLIDISIDGLTSSLALSGIVNTTDISVYKITGTGEYKRLVGEDVNSTPKIKFSGWYEI